MSICWDTVAAALKQTSESQKSGSEWTPYVKQYLSSIDVVQMAYLAVFYVYKIQKFDSGYPRGATEPLVFVRCAIRMIKSKRPVALGVEGIAEASTQAQYRNRVFGRAYAFARPKETPRRCVVDETAKVTYEFKHCRLYEGGVLLLEVQTSNGDANEFEVKEGKEGFQSDNLRQRDGPIVEKPLRSEWLNIVRKFVNEITVDSFFQHRNRGEVAQIKRIGIEFANIYDAESLTILHEDGVTKLTPILSASMPNTGALASEERSEVPTCNSTWVSYTTEQTGGIEVVPIDYSENTDVYEIDTFASGSPEGAKDVFVLGTCAMRITKCKRVVALGGGGIAEASTQAWSSNCVVLSRLKDAVFTEKGMKTSDCARFIRFAVDTVATFLPVALTLALSVFSTRKCAFDVGRFRVSKVALFLFFIVTFGSASVLDHQNEESNITSLKCDSRWCDDDKGDCLIAPLTTRCICKQGAPRSLGYVARYQKYTCCVELGEHIDSTGECGTYSPAIAKMSLVIAVSLILVGILGYACGRCLPSSYTRELAVGRQDDLIERACVVRDGYMLHHTIGPEKWCIKKEDLSQFRRLVHRAVREQRIQPTVSDQFDPTDDDVGPNMYTVAEQFITPITAAAGNPSWALMLHPDGLECDLFITHCWQEGIYEFVDKAIHSWPRGKKHAYVCFLSNPQNLDIADLIGSPSESPFAHALRSATVYILGPTSSSVGSN